MGIRVLNVNYHDVVGAQFNNFECRDKLKSYDIVAKFCVWINQSNASSVTTLWTGGKIFSRWLRGGFWVLERLLSVQSMLYPFGLQMPWLKCFKHADIVHYHIIHNGYFSLLTLPWLTRKKPSLWTIHDPWLMTGHCIYPMGCEKWKTGCGNCPDLKISMPLKKDRTRFLTRYKQWVVQRSNVEFIVSSEWMKYMAMTSEITKNKTIHLLPFGVDLDLFKPRDNKSIREQLDIPEDNFVIFFRATSSAFKGLDHIVGMLPKLLRETNRPVTLISVEHIGLLDSFFRQCQIIEFGWQNDSQLLADLYAACDIFLMPSTAEAFGVMAIEAMASGKPVVYLEGTSLTEVVKTGGVGVPMHQHEALADVVLSLVHDEEKRATLGKKARAIAEQFYDINTYLKNLSDVYKKVYYKNF